MWCICQIFVRKFNRFVQFLTLSIPTSRARRRGMTGFLKKIFPAGSFLVLFILTHIFTFCNILFLSALINCLFSLSFDKLCGFSDTKKGTFYKCPLGHVENPTRIESKSASGIFRLRFYVFVYIPVSLLLSCCRAQQHNRSYTAQNPGYLFQAQAFPQEKNRHQRG